MFELLYSGALFDTPIESPVLKFFVILAALLISPMIFNKLRIPHILGLIIAGAIIGPYGFNLVLRDTGIVMSGTAGLLYIMFLAGLEINMNEFIKSSFKSLIFGLYTFIIPMCIGIAAGLYLLDFSLMTSLLLASMFASHTLLAYPLISKLGVKRNRVVTVTIGGTVIAETLALLVLAIVVELSKGAVDAIFWLKFSASLSLFAVAIFIGFPILTRFFLKRISDGLYQYIFILFMVYLGATLAEIVEIEGIIGALFTGLALNRLIPQSSALMNRIDFIGNAIFIPFFLISVGMLIDYRVFLTDMDTLYTALIMTLFATIAKYISAWAAQKTFGYTTNERGLIFGLTNARAAATLAVVLVGYNTFIGENEAGEAIRLFNDDVLNGTIIMIFITCTIASISAQRAAQKIAMADMLNLESSGSDEVENILLPINNLESTNELMSFTNLIVPHDHKHVVTIGAVVGESKSEEEQLALSRKIFDRAVQCAASMDRSIETNLRYDLSYTSGVMNMIREMKISDLVLSIDPERFCKGKLLSKILDDTMKSSSTTTFMYSSSQPIETIKRHIIIVPPNAEYELGFRTCVMRIWYLLKHTGAGALIYANAETVGVIKRLSEVVSTTVGFKIVEDYGNILNVEKSLKPNDGLIFILSKRHSPSYDARMEDIPHYINRYFTKTNFLLVYPYQQSAVSGDLENITSNATINAVNKIEDVIDSILGSRSSKKL
ncbi:MAG: cation:proton antiporter [Rikenellaceae bacterium]